MKYGLETEDVERIIAVIALFPGVERAILYGSRAKGTYREGSDIDICLSGRDLNLSVVNTIMQSIYDLNLPYFFDFSIYHRISDPSLLEHINRAGITLFDAKLPIHI
jgi:predicted nucleotidyltransferase